MHAWLHHNINNRKYALLMYGSVRFSAIHSDHCIADLLMNV